MEEHLGSPWGGGRARTRTRTSQPRWHRSNVEGVSFLSLEVSQLGLLPRREWSREWGLPEYPLLPLLPICTP